MVYGTSNGPQNDIGMQVLTSAWLFMVSITERAWGPQVSTLCFPAVGLTGTDRASVAAWSSKPEGNMTVTHTFFSNVGEPAFLLQALHSEFSMLRAVQSCGMFHGDQPTFLPGLTVSVIEKARIRVWDWSLEHCRKGFASACRQRERERESGV